MAKIETTLPTVAFGNVKVTFTPEELGVDISDAAAIGVATAVYLNLFTQGFKTGSQMDVSAPVSASPEAPGPKARTINEVLSDEDVDTVAEAQAILDKELGGVTEIDTVIEETIAKAAEIEAKAPWEAKVDAPKKPWETDEKPAPVALTPGW